MITTLFFEGGAGLGVLDFGEKNKIAFFDMIGRWFLGRSRRFRRKARTIANSNDKNWTRTK
jgi:hypothetical protein